MVMGKAGIKDLSRTELEASLKELGAEPYRLKQVFGWLYEACVNSFDKMTDLSRGLREKLKDKFHITQLTILDSQRLPADGTAKYLFKLEDGNSVEAVLLPEGPFGIIAMDHLPDISGAKSRKSSIFQLPDMAIGKSPVLMPCSSGIFVFGTLYFV